MDILDVFSGRLSPRLALALVEELPTESATATAMRGGADFVGWDRHAYLMADLFDAVSTLVYVTTVVNSKHPRRVDEPEPYPRPDSKVKTSKPDVLLSKLRGGSAVANTGPGDVIPLPP